jgi:hypothetical protein
MRAALHRGDGQVAAIDLNRVAGFAEQAGNLIEQTDVRPTNWLSAVWQSFGQRKLLAFVERRQHPSCRP